MAHERPDEVVRRDQGRVDPRLPGILKRRHEDTAAIRSHLVLMEGELRMELVLHLDGELRLHLGEHVPVPVVVVAGVFLIEERWCAVLVGCASILREPIVDHLLAVRVVYGYVDEYHFVEDALDLVIVPRGKPVRQ